jgi:osmotically inducible protein OsmC
MEVSMPIRTATATWEGGLKAGKGSFAAASGLHAAFGFGTRFGDEPGANPEELLAAAHAACYSMALSAGLEKAGTPPTKVETKALCTLEKLEAGFTVTKMRLECRASVPGIDAAKFAEIATATKAGCPISRALAAIATIELDAQLM